MRVLILVLMIAASSCTSQEELDKEQRDLCEPEFGEIIYHNKIEQF